MWKRGWIERRIKRGNGQTEWLNGREEGKLERTSRRRSKTENQNGLAEGERVKQLEIAKNLIKLGINIDDIVKATGLSKEEIENLIKENKKLD